MRYLSTRGQTAAMPFKDAVITGLAPDGGLLVPESFPDVRGQLDDWRDLHFTELAKAVVGLYATDIAADVLSDLVDRAYASFDHPDVVAFETLGELTVLELFHGPTLAFKDVALQLLGQLFEHILAERGEHLNIVGATSGDTGSAAIAGVRGQHNVDIFIMFPKGRVSPLQELQMTSVMDPNVHCLAVNGSFDDCQSMMKQTFSDLEFKAQHNLGAVNSVNWARVLAQVVYYGYASLRLGRAQPVTFCVPTGNFGNIFAGYVARCMGFPIERLVLATNDNDILARFFKTGTYQLGDVHHTITPAMDIQVASNFERYLYYHLQQDATALRRFMADFASHGLASLDGPPNDPAFAATAVNVNDTLAAISQVYERFGYVADPHTAVGLAAAAQLKVQGPLVCVATAHPAKFPESVDKALGVSVARHERLEALRELPSRFDEIAPSVDALKRYVTEHARTE